MIYQEINLEDALVRELNRVVANLKYNPKICDKKDYDPSIASFHGKARTSEEALKQVLAGHDRNVATADENVYRIPPHLVKSTFIPEMFEELMLKMCKVSFGLFHITGKFWYPKNGYMGWHTNNAYPGYRFYCSHAQESNKSFFRYQDPDTKEIITSWDKEGWTGRLFKIDVNKPLWHCVYSETNRVSTGCNLSTEVK